MLTLGVVCLSVVQKIQSLETNMVTPEESALERNISELKVSLDKLMTGQVVHAQLSTCVCARIRARAQIHDEMSSFLQQYVLQSLLFRRLNLEENKLGRVGRDKDGDEGVDNVKREVDAPALGVEAHREQLPSQKNKGIDNSKSEVDATALGDEADRGEWDVRLPLFARERMKSDKQSRPENLREREKERERGRVKARENRGKGDRKLLVSALDELRAVDTATKPASKQLSKQIPPPSPGDRGLQSGDRYDQPLNSFQVFSLV